jgi:hypothetical protein
MKLRINGVGAQGPASALPSHHPTMRRRRAEVVASGFQWLVGAALFMGATGISAVASADEALLNC